MQNMLRQIITISGERSACLKMAQDLTINLDVTIVNASLHNNNQKTNALLGQEFDAVVFDLHEKFDANEFGAITGTIRGGGYLVLLIPEDTDQALTTKRSHFLQRFYTILNASPALTVKLRAADKPRALAALLAQRTDGTVDQNKAVEAIIHVVKGHRRRPVLITSDRGRGKSAALGIAAAKLLKSGYQHICVCAPSKKAAAVVFQHVNAKNAQNEKDSDGQLVFYSPDELIQNSINTDLVLVDEAAAIPLNLLQQLLKKYPRLVFATTEHGYEGSGRGFSIRFKQLLEKQTSGWKQCQLQTPIRWQENDPLEQFTFDALLLNAEVVKEKEIQSSSLADYQMSFLNKNKLIENEETLKYLFGLLVTAHYQTKPSDLQYLLDDERVRIVAIYHSENPQQIVAIALVAQEGELNQEMATSVFNGTRRPKGNLVAQALASNVGIENAPCLRGDRVVRIAVHPNLQNRGFGTAMLKFIGEVSDADYLSSSFGATPELLTFWDKSQFIPVNVGSKRDASSGVHSVIVLKAQNKEGEVLIAQAKQHFCRGFPHLLADPLKELEPEIVAKLLCINKAIEIDEDEKRELSAFAIQQRTYETSIYPISKLISKFGVLGLQKEEQEVIVMKILQKQSWHSIVDKMSSHVSGKKQALALLRQAIQCLSKRSGV